MAAGYDATGWFDDNGVHHTWAEGAYGTAVANQGAPTPISTGSGGGKSIDQMKSELRVAGYPGPWDDASVQAAYARTANGGSGGGAGGMTGFNSSAAQIAAQVASAAAQQAYLNARLTQLEIPQFQAQNQVQLEQLAQQAARDAWAQKYQQATLDIQKGTFDWQKEMQLADLTGYVPASAAATPAVDFTGASQKLVDAYNQGARGPASWAATLHIPMDQATTLFNAAQAWQQQPGNQGLPASDAVIAQLAAQNGIGVPTAAAGGTGQPQETLARQQFESNAAQGWQALLNQQQGPQGAFHYLNTLQNVPGQMRDIINNALRGQGYAGGIDQAAAIETGGPTATTGMGGNLPTRALGTGDAAATGPRLGPLVHNPDGTITHAAAPRDAGGSALPLGSQINARDWLNTSPYVKNLTLAGYSANGQDPTQVMDEFQKSLPQYATATGTRYRQPALAG